MHTRNPWTVTKPLFAILFTLTLLTAGPLWAEEIRLTTYYPSPFGEYDQLESNNLVVYGDVLLATVAGSVGIGTVSPNELLEIGRSATVGGALRLNNLDTSINAGQSIGRVDFYSSDASAGSTGVMARIDAPAVNGDRTDLAFSVGHSTGSGSPTLVEAIRIENTTGNVGIGTTSPTRRLHVQQSGTHVTIGMNTGFLQYGNSATEERLEVGNPGSLSGDWRWVFRRDGTIEHYTVEGGWDNVLTSSTNGNVGIGTTSPSNARLHVRADYNQVDSGAIVGGLYQVNSLNFADLTANAGHVGLIGVGNYAGQVINLPENPLGTQWASAGAVGISTGTSGSAWAHGVVGLAQTITTTTGRTAGGFFKANTNGNLNGGETLYGVYATADGTTNTNGGDNVYGVYSTVTGQGSDATRAGYFSASGGGTNHAIYSAAGNNYFSGNVGIGTVSPGFKLDVAGAVHGSSFPTSSDVQFKANVTPIVGALAKLSAIQGVSFNWNETYQTLGRATPGRQLGVIAQEVEAVLPELVTTWGPEGYRAVDYGRLSAVLIEAIKEQQGQLEAQAAQLKQLQVELTAVQARL